MCVCVCKKRKIEFLLYHLLFHTYRGFCCIEFRWDRREGGNDASYTISPKIRSITHSRITIYIEKRKIGSIDLYIYTIPHSIQYFFRFSVSPIFLLRQPTLVQPSLKTESESQRSTRHTYTPLPTISPNFILTYHSTSCFKVELFSSWTSVHFNLNISSRSARIPLNSFFFLSRESPRSKHT